MSVAAAPAGDLRNQAPVAGVAPVHWHWPEA
jgi:hypothetical protein